jgi:TPR repeat protein
MGGVRVKHHSIPYQAATFLRTIYREAPEEVAEVWQRLTQRRLPDWLTRKDIDFTEEVWFRYAVDCGMTDAIRPLAELLEKQGKLLEAERLYHNAAAAGDTVAMMRLATILRRPKPCFAMPRQRATPTA